MIVDQDTHPQHDLYYLGARVLELLGESDEVVFDYLELHSAVKKNISISFNMYSLTLDWLYLLGTIEKNEQGGIKKCF